MSILQRFLDIERGFRPSGVLTGDRELSPDDDIGAIREEAAKNAAVQAERRRREFLAQQEADRQAAAQEAAAQRAAADALAEAEAAAKAEADAAAEAARQAAFLPQEQVDRYANIVTGIMGGYPGQTQTTNVPNPTPLQTALGVGTTLAGIYGAVTNPGSINFRFPGS